MIGIFDSGIGGLTVVKELQKVLPGYAFRYLGDTARMPYGNKSPEAIIQYALDDAEELVKHGAKILVVACNSASSVALPALREKYPEIPIFDVIGPAVKHAHDVSKGRVGVIGTRATINSGIYERELTNAKKIEVFGQACPLLVPLVEENWLDKPATKMVLRSYLYPLKRQQIDTLILACTHYPLLKNIIHQKAGKRVAIIDPAEETAATIKHYLQEHPDLDAQLAKNGEAVFTLTDVTPHANDMAARWLGHPVRFEKVNLS
ncbi:MAG: glutamate racemase [Candidatus Nomurabacteria bacterium]|nr:MAG: glutamate racemase [Candidatus Nomurabacteria bacterium]